MNNALGKIESKIQNLLHFSCKRGVTYANIDLEELIAQVFDPFYTTKAEGMGTGLGLSICKNILEDHRGTIDLTSQSGIGTVVSIRIPSVSSKTPTGDSIGAAILAGGKSSKIGRDKALIKLGGKSIVEKILETV